MGYVTMAARTGLSQRHCVATAIKERSMKPVNVLRPVMALLLISFLLPPMIKALSQWSFTWHVLYEKWTRANRPTRTPVTRAGDCFITWTSLPSPPSFVLGPEEPWVGGL